MTMTKDEESWITNVRKSVINLFRIYPVQKDIEIKLKSEELQSTTAFTVMEDTMLGTCESL